MRSIAVAAAYVAAYVALDWVSYIHPHGPFGITPWNPPPGLSIALLLVFGLRYAPALLAAGVAAELAVRGWPAHPATALAAIGVAAAGYTATAAAVRRCVRLDPPLATVNGAAWFTGLVAAGAMAIAFAYVAVHAVAGAIAWGDVLPAALQFWVGDAIGILVTTPVVVHLLQSGARPRRGRAEIAAQAAAVAASLWAVFWIVPAEAAKFFYLLFLPLLWVSMRHGARGAALALLAIQLGVVTAVELQGHGSATMVELQLFMATLAVTGLVLGALVSERGRARAALEAREAQLHAVVTTAPDGILVLDDRGRILRANPAAAAMLGAPALALHDAAVTEFVPGLRLGARPVPRAAYSAHRRGGADFPVEIALGRTRVGGEPLYIAVLRDVSERERMEEALRARDAELARSLRLAAAAETASALAHELNQPLSAIGNYVRACRLMLEDPAANRERLRATMSTVVVEVGRAAEVMRRLREFFGSGVSRFERTTVRDLASAAATALAGRLAGAGIALTIEVEPGLPEVRADRLQVETVLHNLIGNAIDAISSREGGERRIVVRARPAGATVEISVIDSGPGLSPEQASRLFKPFASTKPDGMGLGLAISRSLVENHGGRLAADGTGGGARFWFTLPIAAAEEAA